MSLGCGYPVMLMRSHTAESPRPSATFREYEVEDGGGKTRKSIDVATSRLYCRCLLHSSISVSGSSDPPRPSRTADFHATVPHHEPAHLPKPETGYSCRLRAAVPNKARNYLDGPCQRQSRKEQRERRAGLPKIRTASAWLLEMTWRPNSPPRTAHRRGPRAKPRTVRLHGPMP
eukprot:966596-Prymnesium_polylepis.1